MAAHSPLGIGLTSRSHSSSSTWPGNDSPEGGPGPRPRGAKRWAGQEDMDTEIAGWAAEEKEKYSGAFPTKTSFMYYQ